jgi:predicted alpha/beta hydrolase family esterase
VNRKAILLHGTAAHPDVVWLPWLRNRLTERGYAVEAPHYPGLNVESIATFLPKVLANHTFDANTVLVGHIDTRVNQAILVAGYCTQPNTEDEPVLQDAYDWGAIRANVRDLYFINSREDPYGCDDKQGRAMFERLGGTLIIRDDGHFGDIDQPYESFELLDRLID